MCRNRDGFTLIEFMVALVILMFGMLALLQAINVSIQSGMTTQLRNEAVTLGDTQINIELAKPFDLVSTSVRGKIVQRKIMSGFVNYSVIRSGQVMTNSKQVTYEVRWKHKNQSFLHTVYGASSKTY